jgi:hypothetical protein
VTGLLTTSGSQFHDWTSSYRLFSAPRLPVEAIFAVARRAVVSQLPPLAPVCAVLDDSLLHRAGLHTPGVAWRRDPLGPRFQTNLVRAQRFLQTSLAMPPLLPSLLKRPVPAIYSNTASKLVLPASPSGPAIRSAIYVPTSTPRDLPLICSL